MSENIFANRFLFSLCVSHAEVTIPAGVASLLLVLSIFMITHLFAAKRLSNEQSTAILGSLTILFSVHSLATAMTPAPLKADQFFEGHFANLVALTKVNVTIARSFIPAENFALEWIQPRVVFEDLLEIFFR